MQQEKDEREDELEDGANSGDEPSEGDDKPVDDGCGK